MITKTLIRQDDTTRIELWRSPSSFHLRTEYLEPGFEDTPNNWWAYKTPFVYDMDARQWVIYYRAGEENIPHLNKSERKQCARLIAEYEDELPF